MLPVDLYEWKIPNVLPILTIMFKNILRTSEAEILKGRLKTSDRGWTVMNVLNPIRPGGGGGGHLMPVPTLNSSQFQTI